MLTVLFIAALQTVSGPVLSGDARYHACIEAATTDPADGELDAQRWKAAGGGLDARQCLGVALTNQKRWAGAADEFEEAAHNAALAHDARTASFWVQAGNAWLAAGDATAAQRAFGAALDAGTLDGLARGEAHLDRARALVAAGDPAAARIDLDAALADASDDPLAWLLSATLARRMNDWPRARKDIAEALARASDDASVQLEAGNIAASGGDEDAAKAAWDQALRLAPESPAGRAAGEALQQFSPAPSR